MKILQEEKNYWAAQCLEAREQVERANALADAYLASYEGEEKARKELEERFCLLFELMGVMQRILKKGDKIALYAIDTDHAEE